MRTMTPFAKAAAVLVFCAGAAFAGLMAAGVERSATARRDPDLMRGYYPVPMPRYPGAREYPMSRAMNVGHSPVKMSYFVTQDDPLKVASFYTGRWRSQGHFVSRDITMEGGFVSAVDVKAGVTRQVLIDKRGRGTVVIPSVSANLSRVTPTVNTGANPFDDAPPVFPGSEGVMTFGSTDPGHSNKITVFVNHGGLEANVEFYRVEMLIRGWQLNTHVDGLPGADPNHHVLLFKKREQEITVNLMRIDKSNQVRVHITEVGPR